MPAGAISTASEETTATTMMVVDVSAPLSPPAVAEHGPPLGPENLAVHTQAFAVVLPAGELESSGHAAHVDTCDTCDTLVAPTTPVAENLPSGQSKHAVADEEVAPNVVE